MLKSRTLDERASARASYAIRSQTSEDRWFEVDSTSVDKLVSEPLPPVDRQILNFLRWVAVLVGDDRLGAVDLPNDSNVLAGVVGAVNRDRVDDLIPMIEQAGMIEYVPDNCVRLTPRGWSHVNEKADRVSSSVADPRLTPAIAALTKTPAAPIKAYCPKCGPERHADVLAQHSERWDHEEVAVFTIDNYRILKCRGCTEVYIQREHFFSEDEDVEEDPITGEYESVLHPRVTYWPAPSRRELPDWVADIDAGIRDLLVEVYGALDGNLLAIATMGARALIDKTLDLAGADPADGFASKLIAIEKLGVIGAREKEILLTMTDAGSAASHRGWRPQVQDLDRIVDAVEALLHRVAFLDAAARELRTRVPKRPKKKKP